MRLIPVLLLVLSSLTPAMTFGAARKPVVRKAAPALAAPKPAKPAITPVTKAWDPHDCPSSPGGSVLAPKYDSNILSPQGSAALTRRTGKAVK